MRLPESPPTKVKPDRLAQMIEARQLVFDEQQVLRSNMPCRKCGYNLKTQTLAAACPECGNAVTDSVENYPALTGHRWLIVKLIDLFAFATVWFFCTMAIMLAITGVILLVDQFIPFAAVMHERFSTTGLAILVLFPSFMLARKLAGSIAPD